MESKKQSSISKKASIDNFEKFKQRTNFMFKKRGDSKLFLEKFGIFLNFSIDKLLFILGYVLSYLLFTLVLFFILKYTGREKTIGLVIMITFTISFLGAMLKRWLK